MEALYKLENGYLVNVPSTMEIDGRLMVNFPLISKDYGYKPLSVEPEPELKTWQYIDYAYEELEDVIVRKTIVKDIDLNEYKQQKIDSLKQKHDAELSGEFESQGFRFSYDEKAQQNFTKVTALFNSFPDRMETPWKTKCCGVVSLTREQYMQIILDIETREMYLIGKYWNLEHRVDIAQSYDEVDAVYWEMY